MSAGRFSGRGLDFPLACGFANPIDSSCATCSGVFEESVTEFANARKWNDANREAAAAAGNAAAVEEPVESAESVELVDADRASIIQSAAAMALPLPLPLPFLCLSLPLPLPLPFPFFRFFPRDDARRGCGRC